MLIVSGILTPKLYVADWADFGSALLKLYDNTLSSGISIFKTKEELLKRLKCDIEYDYKMSLEADWHEMGMYVKMDKDYNGVWAYTIMNVCYG